MAELVKPKVAPKKRALIKKKTALETKNKRSVSKENPARAGMRGWLLLAVVVIGAGILIYASGRDNQDIVKSGEDVVQVTEKSGKASIGGAFELTDHNGNLVTNKTFKGKYMLIYFGYSYCPDICPTGLTEISNALDLLGSGADKIAPIFITVDPARDTSVHLKEYVTFFHPRLVGLTGTMEQIKTATRAYRVYFAKVDNKTPDADPEDYTVDHTAIAYLVGPNGEFKQHFGHGTDAKKMAERIKEIISP